MKTTNKILILLLSIFLITGCKCNKDVMEEGIAYGIVYENYVGKASVKTVNGKITTITIDEAYLPTTWAKLKTTDQTDGVVSANGSTYPEYVKVDEEILKITTTETDGSETVKITWSNSKISDLAEYLKMESNAKWYYEALKNNKAYPCDSTGKKLDLELVQAKYFKSEGGYWDKWAPNIEELCKGMVKNEFKEEPTMTEDSKVKFGDIVTSSTIASYKEYYNLAKKAYNKIPK